MATEEPTQESGQRTASAVATERGADRPTGPIRLLLQEYERALWAVVGVSMLADFALTAYGLENGLVEANPVPSMALQAFGLFGLVFLKGVVLAFGVAAWSVLPRRYSFVIPLGLSIPTVAAVLINVVMLATM